jgi:hypothetical protein
METTNGPEESEMVKVMFRAQGNKGRQAGVAVVSRGSKLLIQYRIQDGSERERFITRDRYEVIEGDVATLPKSVSVVCNGASTDKTVIATYKSSGAVAYSYTKTTCSCGRTFAYGREKHSVDVLK